MFDHPGDTLAVSKTFQFRVQGEKPLESSRDNITGKQTHLGGCVERRNLEMTMPRGRIESNADRERRREHVVRNLGKLGAFMSICDQYVTRINPSLRAFYSI